MVLVSQVFVLSRRGDHIIFRDYRKDVSSRAPDTFFRQLKFQKSSAAPVFNMDGVQYCFLQKSSMYFVCTTRTNSSPSLGLELLDRFTHVCKDYLGVCNEQALRLNFILVYELLDEIVDYGHVQDPSSEQLKVYVHNEPYEDSASGGFLAKLKGMKLKKAKTMSSSAANKSIIGSRESKGSSSTENVLFVDVIERLDVIMNSQGSITKASVHGSITLKNFLMGTPTIRMILPSSIVVGKNLASRHGSLVLDDCNFHDCVDRSQWETEKTLLFFPPDGEFKVFNYRVDEVFNIPFRVAVHLEEVSELRLDVLLKVNSENIHEGAFGSNVVVRCPMPDPVTRVTHEFGYSYEGRGQHFEYDAGEKVAMWGINRMDSHAEQTLRLRLTLDRPMTKFLKRQIGPLSLGFEVSGGSVTGLEIISLDIEERGSYSPARWIRHVAMPESYVCRL